MKQQKWTTKKQRTSSSSFHMAKALQAQSLQPRLAAAVARQSRLWSQRVWTLRQPVTPHKR